MDSDNCNTCTPHLDRIRADIAQTVVASLGFSADEMLVEALMLRIAPHLHAAVEDVAYGVLPEHMV